MRRNRPMRVVSGGGPLSWAFPTLSAVVAVVVALARVAGVVVRALWPFRRELVAGTFAFVVWRMVDGWVPDGWAGLVVLALVTGALLVGPVRRVVWGWLVGGRTRRRLLAGMRNTRVTNMDGRLPRVVRVRMTPIGERLWLRLRAGQSIEALDVKVEELRAAVGSRDVRLRVDKARTDRVTVDVVRRDTLTGGSVAWADRDADVLSIWRPVHWGVSELGEPVWLSLVERAVLIGGNRGAGKSSGLNVLVSHLALSPDVELLMIDPNRLQLWPWRDRARAFADHSVDDALDVARMWRDEIDRRLDVMAAHPGNPLGLSRELSAELGLPVWFLVVDELAYHMSVAGTRAQQQEFYSLLRDGVARGRAAGVGAIVATQRPTHDLIPTSLRDLFDIRIAYRTMTRTSSDVILGDDFARRGISATDIDITARGVAWLLAEGQPIRTKTVWIPPELRADLAVTTVRHRPRSKGGTG